jgi:hypothetical protein
MVPKRALWIITKPTLAIIPTEEEEGHHRYQISINNYLPQHHHYQLIRAERWWHLFEQDPRRLQLR